MADVSQIKMPNNSVFTIKDAVARNILDSLARVYYVNGPTTGGTAGVWTGTIEDLSAYYDGLTIIYVPHVNGSSSGCTLKINSLTAVPCYIADKGILTPVTTNYPPGVPIIFTYYDGKFIHADWAREDTVVEVVRL